MASSANLITDIDTQRHTELSNTLPTFVNLSIYMSMANIAHMKSKTDDGNHMNVIKDVENEMNG